MPRTDAETLQRLSLAWERVHVDAMMLLWLTGLAAERQAQPSNVDHPVALAEQRFQSFCASHGQAVDYRLDHATSLLGFAYSMVLSLHESIQSEHGLNSADRKLLTAEVIKDFGNYEDQKDRYSITVRQMDGGKQPTPFSILHRLRNGLGHNRYDFDDSAEWINVKDKRPGGELTADFSMRIFSLYDFVYGCSRSLLSAAQTTGLYVGK